jgi:hypothetical protein
MNLAGINPWSVLVAAVATMIVGFLWYSPLLFAKPWIILMGYDPNDKAKLKEMQQGAGKMYCMTFVASLVAAGVLAKIISLTTIHSLLYGAKVGFAVWLGFVTTVQLTDMLFGKRPTKLYLINTGFQLVCYLVMGAIVAVMRK